ncbi:MAG: NAD(P)H-binding protein [Anaerolineaceae bacterium]|nr:NAD(P)H-binding protein [Anaerolineaceae bacterium]
MRKTILVLGGTGLLGKPVAVKLNEAGFNVRILSRNADKAKTHFNDDIEIIEGNPANEADLVKAIQGCSGVHISLPNNIEQQVTEAVAKVAKSQKIKHITYISGASVAQENRFFSMVDGKFLAEKALQESGIPYTIFAPSWIIDSLPLFVRDGQASIIGKFPEPVHMLTADDLGIMVSEAHSLENDQSQRIVVLGPEAIHMKAALQQYCAAHHPEIKKVSVTPVWMIKLIGTLTKNDELKFVGEMMGYFAKAGKDTKYHDGFKGFSAPQTTLTKWIETQK